MAPLIDLVFLLLIFFLLTSSFVMQTGVKVEIPESESARQLSRQDLIVVVTREGKILVNGKRVALEKLENYLTLMAKTARDKTAIIRADRNAPWGMGVRVMGIVDKVGLKVAVEALPAQKSESKRQKSKR